MLLNLLPVVPYCLIFHIMTTNANIEPQTEYLDFEFNRKKMLDAHGNSNWRARNGRIAKLREVAREKGQEIKETRDVFFAKFKVRVFIKPPIRSNLDPPNFYPTVKPLIDGLTDAGWWEDDSLQYMMEMSFRYGGLSGVKNADGTRAYRVILEIEEVLDDSEYITEKEFFN